MLTDIIIVSYQDQEHLDKCVSSIKENCKNYNIIIEDNNPPNPNRGFTVAVNAAIKKSNGDYVWLLSSDAMVLPKAQEALLKKFEHSPRAGICGSMQVDEKDQDIIKWCGPLQVFPNGIHDGGKISNGYGLLEKKIVWQNFASAMLRRDMIHEIGLLDENMHFIFSDSDYSLMARYRGWEIWYCPESKVIHRLRGSKQTTEWHRKDMEAFMLKWSIEPTGQPNAFRVGNLFNQLAQPIIEPLEEIEMVKLK